MPMRASLRLRFAGGALVRAMWVTGAGGAAAGRKGLTVGSAPPETAALVARRRGGFFVSGGDIEPAE